MKEAFIILVLFSVFACKQIKEEPALSVEVVHNLDTLVSSKYKYKASMDRVKNTSGKFPLGDLTEKFCLVFGMGENESDDFWESINNDSLIGYIMDPTYEEFSNLNELRAQRLHIYPNNDSLPICNFENSILIPFILNEERRYITKWDIISSDSIAFDRLIQPALERRYSNIVSIDVIRMGNEDFISLYLKGGEGGENWDELIVAKYNNKDEFEIIASQEVGYCHDCGNWAKISLQLKSVGFEMIEIRDSMTLINDKWERVWHKTKMLGTVNVNTKGN